jgi:hypothetical protein
MKLQSFCAHIFIMSSLVFGVNSFAQNISSDPHRVQDEIQHRALQFFLENANSETGQVLDRAQNFESSAGSNIASIASTGFGLTVIANAATHGWVTEKFAREYTYKAIEFAASHVPRRRGWFVHFYDWQTGENVWSSEYSTIDTALFLAGALYASHVLKDQKLVELVNQIYSEVDFWDAMTDGGSQPLKRTLSMGYFEKRGYIISQWHTYSEQMVLLVLGLGSPTRPLPPETWLAFDRDVRRYTPSDASELYGLSKPLFIHQYSQLFLDLRTFDDGYQNYFENSRAVSVIHRNIKDTDARFKTLREGFWGFSAGETPKGYNIASALTYEGTVCIGCMVASAPYFPTTVLGDAAQWINGPYSQKIWGRYGFTDSINLDENWYSPSVLGITVGPEYLALANLNSSSSIWNVFMKIPEIKLGLARAAEAHLLVSTH